MKVATLLVLFSCFWSSCNGEFFRVCYYTNWAQYRPGNARFTPEDIDAHLCTHIIFAFAKLNNITYKMETVEWNDIQMFRKVCGIVPSLKKL